MFTLILSDSGMGMSTMMYPYESYYLVVMHTCILFSLSVVLKRLTF